LQKIAIEKRLINYFQPFTTKGFNDFLFLAPPVTPFSPCIINWFNSYSPFFQRQIVKWIKAGDITKLEYATLLGKGKFIMGKPSWNDEARIFIKNVPKLMVNFLLPLDIHFSEKERRARLYKLFYACKVRH
jgi:hypothetical protein